MANAQARLRPGVGGASPAATAGAKLFEAAVAVEELLRFPARRLVQFLGAFDEAETSAEFAVERVGVITHDVEAAAFCGALRAESTDNHVAAGLDGVSDLADVGGAFLRGSK